MRGAPGREGGREGAGVSPRRARGGAPARRHWGRAPPALGREPRRTSPRIAGTFQARPRFVPGPALLALLRVGPAGGWWVPRYPGMRGRAAPGRRSEGMEGCLRRGTACRPAFAPHAAITGSPLGRQASLVVAVTG